MKRAIILVLVVGLLLGLVHIGLSLQSSSAAPPQQPPGGGTVGPRLLTIAENVTLAPQGEEGYMFNSEWLNVQSYRLFKLYARTPYVSETPPPRVRAFESPLGNVDEGSYGEVEADYELRATPSGHPNRWVMATPFEGLYSKILVYAENESGENVTVSLYLLMAQD
jgi:hypothetical protein